MEAIAFEQQRIVPAISANRPIQEAPCIEDLAKHIRGNFEPEEIKSLYQHFQNLAGDFGIMHRGIILRALLKSCGRGLIVESGAGFKHPETFIFGEGVFIGANAYLQGRFDGCFQVGDRCWFGPQSYYDCRALKIGNYVGIGPGAKFLGSEHTGLPLNVPIITTDLVIKQTIVEDDVDIGTGAVILPGVIVGKGAIIGAGTVVNKDIPAYTIAAGVPARIIKSRKDDST